MRVIAADVATCRLPLPHPVRLGAVVQRTRDYVALQLRTDAGLVGHAYGYTRATPLAQALEQVAAAVLGTDPLWRKRTLSGLRAANPAGSGALVRATSLLDVALWDLAAKAAELPLHQLLGGARERVPLMPVCGYAAAERGDEAVLDEVAGLCARGFRRLKIIGGAREPRAMHAFVAAAHERLAPGATLGVDVHYSLRSLEDATRLGRALDEVPGLAFLEDPLPPSRWRDLAALRSRIATPLAAGEDVADAAQYRDLLDAASVLRVDASTCGGVTAALHGVELAGAHGAAVIPHVFPRLHGQLAGALEQIAAVETILPETGADPIEELLAEPLQVEDGELVLSRAPGAGTALDWALVERRAEVLAPVS